MDEFTSEQTALYAFTVKDGRGRPAKIDGDPVTADSNPAVATSSVAAGALDADGNIVSGGVGQFVMSVVASTASMKDGDGNPIPEQSTVTIDADLTPEGVDDRVGAVQYVVTADPRTGAKSIEFATAVVKDTPLAT